VVKGKRSQKAPGDLSLKDEDIYAAMAEIPGYLDITPSDFQEVYRLAYQHALARLGREVTAAEVMTREVAFVRTDTPVAEVAELMGRLGVSGVPVLDDKDRVAGIISEKDFLRRMGVKESENFMTLVATCLKTKGCVALPIKNRTAAELMSAPAVTVRPETKTGEIARLMSSRHINRVPVTDAEGRLLGIVTRWDLLRAGRLEIQP
jgi:CBS domain-containing membrane protein